MKSMPFTTISLTKENYRWLMSLQKKHPYLKSTNAILDFIRFKCSGILDGKLSTQNHNEVKAEK